MSSNSGVTTSPPGAPGRHRDALIPGAVTAADAAFTPRTLADLATRDWHLSRAWVATIVLLPVALGASAVGLAIASRDVYLWMTKEDGAVESVQLLLFASACVLSFLVAHRHQRERQSFLGALYYLLGAALIVICGEEISWGQRIFGWDTPEALATNRQSESNIHNIPQVEAAIRLAQVIVGAAGVVLPLLMLRRTFLPPYRALLSWLVPHFTLIPYWGTVMAWRLYRLIWPHPIAYSFALIRFNEIVEMILALALFFFVFYQYRRGHQAPVTALHA